MFVAAALLVVGAGTIVNNETERGFVHFFDRDWFLDRSNARVVIGKGAVGFMIFGRISVLLGALALIGIRST